MYIFLTLYTKHLNIKSSQNLQKEKKKNSQTTGSYIITLAVLHRTCLQCKYTEMYYSYFTFHIQIKRERNKSGWVRGYGEERAARTTAALSWFWGLKHTGGGKGKKICSDLKQKQKNGKKVLIIASWRAKTQSDIKVTIAFQKTSL